MLAVRFGVLCLRLGFIERVSLAAYFVDLREQIKFLFDIAPAKSRAYIMITVHYLPSLEP